jgi:AhpD family alkylhydroperoxidase
MQDRLNPDLVRESNSFTDSLLSDGDASLDKETIELIALAASICFDCAPCTEFHIIEARKHGATDEEINKVFKVVMAASAGRTKVFARSLQRGL